MTSCLKLPEGAVSSYLKFSTRSNCEITSTWRILTHIIIHYRGTFVLHLQECWFDSRHCSVCYPCGPGAASGDPFFFPWKSKKLCIVDIYVVCLCVYVHTCLYMCDCTLQWLGTLPRCSESPGIVARFPMTLWTFPFTAFGSCPYLVWLTEVCCCVEHKR